MSEMFKITVQNRVKDGYRRAGLSLPLGDSVLGALTPAQVVALQNDHRLVVGAPEPESGNGKQVSKNGDGTDTKKTVDGGVLSADLNKLTVEQLKTSLTSLGVQFDSKAVKADLVVLLADATKQAQDGK